MVDQSKAAPDPGAVTSNRSLPKTTYKDLLGESGWKEANVTKRLTTAPCLYSIAADVDRNRLLPVIEKLVAANMDSDRYYGPPSNTPHNHGVFADEILYKAGVALDRSDWITFAVLADRGLFDKERNSTYDYLIGPEAHSTLQWSGGNTGETSGRKVHGKDTRGLVTKMVTDGNTWERTITYYNSKPILEIKDLVVVSAARSSVFQRFTLAPGWAATSNPTVFNHVNGAKLSITCKAGSRNLKPKAFLDRHVSGKEVMTTAYSVDCGEKRTNKDQASSLSTLAVYRATLVVEFP